MKNKELTYDQAYVQLQNILEELQGEQTSIELLNEKVVKANELIKYCREKLRTIEKSVKKSISSLEEDPE